MSRGKQDGPQDSERPIFNQQAEAALLGALLIDNRVLAQVSPLVSRDDFYLEAHRRIFGAISKLIDRGRVANPITLKPIVENDQLIAELGGPPYLVTLTGSPMGIALVMGAQDYARQVRELAQWRAMRAAYLEAADAALDVGLEDDLLDLVARTEGRVWNAVAGERVAKAVSAGDMLRLAADRSTRPAGTEGAKCRSIPELDVVIGPIEPSYNIIGGRPGMGKTMLACSAAWGYAANGHPVDYFHAEMTSEQMGLRIASDLSSAIGIGIPHKTLRAGTMNEAQLRDLQEVLAKVDLLPLRFRSIAGWDLSRLKSEIARSKAFWAAKGKKPPIVIVDYLQRIAVRDAKGNTISESKARVDAVSQGMLDVVDRLELPVIGLAQLSRDVEKRPDKRPKMSDLKDTGNLEQDADSVTLVHRPEAYLADEEPAKDSKEWSAWDIEMRAWAGKVELISGKNRHDKRVTRKVDFLEDFMAIRGASYDSRVDQPGLI